MKRLARHPVLLALVAVVATAAVLTPLATAERSQVGNLIVSLNGGIHPRTLPRSDPAPVGVHLSGRVITADKTPVPRVNWIRLELAWRGVLHTKGLPVCPQSRLAGRLSAQAMRACGSALVGKGELSAEIFVPYQDPFGITAHLLVFNGKSKTGRPEVLVHAFTANPPVSFVIPFTRPQGGPLQNDPDHDDPQIDRPLAPRRRLPRRDLTQIQLPRPPGQLSERLLSDPAGLHRRFPLLRPGDLHLRGRETAAYRIGAQLPRPLAPLPPGHQS